MLTAVLILWRLTIWSLVAALAITALSIGVAVFVLTGLYGLLMPGHSPRSAITSLVAFLDEASARLRALRPD